VPQPTAPRPAASARTRAQEHRAYGGGRVRVGAAALVAADASGARSSAGIEVPSDPGAEEDGSCGCSCRATCPWA
jgi:hypothetical protein